MIALSSNQPGRSLARRIFLNDNIWGGFYITFNPFESISSVKFVSHIFFIKDNCLLLNINSQLNEIKFLFFRFWIFTLERLNVIKSVEVWVKMGAKISEIIVSKTTLDFSTSKFFFLIFLYTIVHTTFTKTLVIICEFYYKLYFTRLNIFSKKKIHSPLYYLIGNNMSSMRRFRIFYGILSLFTLITLYITADPLTRKILLGATILTVICIAVALYIKHVKSKKNES